MGPRYVKSYKYVIIIVQFKKKGYNILHVTLNQKKKNSYTAVKENYS